MNVMISTRFHFQPRTSQKRPLSSDKQPVQLVPVSSKVICLPHRMRRRLSPRDMPQPSSNRFRTNFLRPPQRQARGFTDSYRLRCSEDCLCMSSVHHTSSFANGCEACDAHNCPTSLSSGVVPAGASRRVILLYKKIPTAQKGMVRLHRYRLPISYLSLDSPDPGPN